MYQTGKGTPYWRNYGSNTTVKRQICTRQEKGLPIGEIMAQIQQLNVKFVPDRKRVPIGEIMAQIQQLSTNWAETSQKSRLNSQLFGKINSLNIRILVRK